MAKPTLMTPSLQPLSLVLLAFTRPVRETALRPTSAPVTPPLPTSGLFIPHR